MTFTEFIEFSEPRENPSGKVTRSIANWEHVHDQW